MSIFQSSSIASFTRGGQTTIHFIRMIGQVFSRFMALAMLVYLVSAAAIFWSTTDGYDRYLTVKWALAQVAFKGLKRSDGTSLVTRRDGRATRVQSSVLLTNQGLLQFVERVYLGAAWGLVGGFFTVIVIMLLVLKFIYGFGSSQAKNEHVRGSQLVDGPELKKRVRKFDRVPEATLACIPMPRGADVAHSMLSSSSGTDKSTVA